MFLKKFSLTIIILLVGAAAAMPASAFSEKDEFPKLANYYLQPLVPEIEYANLAKYDLVVLDVDTQTIDPGLFKLLKQINPDIKTFAYLPSQSVNVQDLGEWARFRKLTYDEANQHDRWLKDDKGNYVFFSNTWPTIRFVDIGNGWAEYLSEMAKKDVMSRGMWDGIFYDMVFANLSWLNDGNVDLDKNGARDDINAVNNYWLSSSNSLIEKTKAKTNAPVIANVDIPEKFNQLDGKMYENFPASWMGANAWSRIQKDYINNSTSEGKPKIYIINGNTGNVKNMRNFQKMRYGLTSTLLGNGYYSFDSGDQDHAQTWWYDEYNVKLGKAISKPYNLLEPNNPTIKPGLWRRDFENGVSIVNSTNNEQRFVFNQEEFEKIRGTQDKVINDGTKINWLKISAKDGIILLKKNNKIYNNGFINGSFVRVFDNKGAQTTNGFFAYEAGYPGDTQMLLADLDNDGKQETIANGKGQISVYKNNARIANFYPYGNLFNKSITIAVADINNDGQREIITGTGKGAGPQVRIFSNKGKLLNGGFFAYEKNFRGGVNIAVADLNGDGTKEIVTGSGPGGSPQVRIFSTSGKLLSAGFFAYDKSFRSGVSVAAGDINGDGQQEIITSPATGAGPQIKIFNQRFKLLGQFFAYNKNQRSSVRVMTSDMNKDKIDEILVGTENFIN